jgi:hypothetical protein
MPKQPRTPNHQSTISNQQSPIIPDLEERELLRLRLRQASPRRAYSWFRKIAPIFNYRV